MADTPQEPEIIQDVQTPAPTADFMPGPDTTPATPPVVVPAATAEIAPETPAEVAPDAGPVEPADDSRQMAVIATCRLQPAASYADAELGQIPTGSAITVLDLVEKDEHQRPWRKVEFDGRQGWIQQQNIRPL